MLKTLTTKHIAMPHEAWLQKNQRRHGHILRDRFNCKFSYAVPNQKALAAIAARSPIVEIAAGRGYWASLLRNAGVDIVAYDINPGTAGDEIPQETSDRYPPDLWTEVKCADESIVTQHPDRTLLIVWPEICDMAYNALCLYKGNTFIYVGEHPDDYLGHDSFFTPATATEAFFGELKKQWTLTESIAIQRLHNSYDALYIYEKKKE